MLEKFSTELAAMVLPASPSWPVDELTLEYKHWTARFAQFWQGWAELQAFFWRTHRSQALRRPDEP